MSNLNFEAWLATLSLDAAHSDLCPNLAYIPIRQLRRLWREDCPPGAEAISAHQWKKRAPRAVRPLVGVSTERLIAEAQRRGISLLQLKPAPESRRARMKREMAARGHTDAARSSKARSAQDRQMAGRAIHKAPTGNGESPENEG